MTTFATTEFLPAPEHYVAPQAVPTTRTDRERPRRLLPTVIVLVICAWLLSGFWLSVQLRSPRQPFPSPTASQSWVQAPSGGATAFFLLHLPDGPRPLTATLWLEGDQQVTPYINGAESGPAAHRAGPAAGDGHRPPEVRRPIRHPRLARHLEQPAGPRGGQPGQPSARLSCPGHLWVRKRYPADVRDPAGVLALDHRRPADRAERAGVRGVHRPRTPVGIWQPAETAQPRSGTATVTVPPDAYSTPPFGHGMVGNVAVESFAASTVINVPSGCQEGWVRIRRHRLLCHLRGRHAHPVRHRYEAVLRRSGQGGVSVQRRAHRGPVRGALPDRRPVPGALRPGPTRSPCGSTRWGRHSCIWMASSARAPRPPPSPPDRPGTSTSRLGTWRIHRATWPPSTRSRRPFRFPRRFSSHAASR